jgi:hypothetical protein
METLNTDEILKNATSLKKSSSEDDAISYLISIVHGNYLPDHDLVRIIQKISIYIKKSNDKTRNAAKDLYDILISNSERQNIKTNLYEEYGNLLLAFENYDESENYISGSIASISPNDAFGYLYRGHQLYQKRAQIILLTTRSESKKALDYLYFHLSSNLLLIAWHLFVDTNANLRKSFGSRNIADLTFNSFNIFNNIKTSSETSNFPFDNKQSVNYFEIISNEKSIEYFSKIFKSISFEEYPKTLGLNTEFLAPEFNDLGRFIDDVCKKQGCATFLETFPSKSAIVADNLVNDFLRKASV